MANQTLAINITELIPEITLEAQFIYQNASVGRQLVTVKDVDGEPGNTIEFPRFTEVTGITNAAEGTAPTYFTMDLTMPTATIAKRNVAIQLSGLAVRGSREDIVQKAGMAMALAKAKQDDTAIFNVVTATTEYTTGTGATNAALTITNALAALLLLQKNEVMEPISFVTNATGYNGIRTALTPVANDDGVSNAVAEDVIRNALASRAFGMNWYVTERISSGTVTATTQVYNSLAFVKSGIGYAHAWSPFGSGVQLDHIPGTDTMDLIMNYYDSAIVAHGPGVCKVYHT